MVTTRSGNAAVGGGGRDDGDDAGLLRVSGGEVAGRPATEYEMRYPLLGSAPELTSVPTHFFKVILAVPSSSSSSSSSSASSAPVAVAAFVLPNAPIPADTPMESFVVPLGSLEAAAGLSFFRQGALGGDVRNAPHLSAFDSSKSSLSPPQLHSVLVTPPPQMSDRTCHVSCRSYAPIRVERMNE